MSNDAMQDAVDSLTGTPEAAPAESGTEEVESNVELDLSGDNEVIGTEEIPAVEAPNSWSKGDKEHFSTLPHETQVSIANRERDRDLNIRQTQDKVAEESKALEADRTSIKEHKTKLLEKMKVYGPKEPSKDMLNPEHEDFDTDGYHLQKANFDEAQEKQSELEDEISLETAEERKKWQLNEIDVYKEIMPEFVDTEKGPAVRQELATYATKAFGYTMEEAAKVFPITPAREMLILKKAMLYDAAVAKQKAGKQTPKPKTLAAGGSNPKSKATDRKSVAAHFDKTGSKDDALALLGIET